MACKLLVSCCVSGLFVFVVGGGGEFWEYGCFLSNPLRGSSDILQRRRRAASRGLFVSHVLLAEMVAEAGGGGGGATQ